MPTDSLNLWWITLTRTPAHSPRWPTSPWPASQPPPPGPDLPAGFLRLQYRQAVVDTVRASAQPRPDRPAVSLQRGLEGGGQCAVGAAAAQVRLTAVLVIARPEVS